MVDVKNITNKTKEKWSELTKSKRIAIIIISVGIIASILAFIIYNNFNKYGVLFSNMNPKDSGAVLAKLKEKKIEYKVEGNTIKVPKNQVDTLRLQMASEIPLTNGSVGFEIFDKDKFGSTDEEMKIKYQRALEGELERTIKSLPEVQDAKVNLVMSDDSVFVRNPNKASASLTIKLKSGKELRKDQVKAIVDLLCSSVKNLNRKNVVIVAATDNDTKLLTTPDLFNDNNNYVDNTQEQEKIKRDVEKRLEDKVQAMLDKVYGSNNVVVKVNASLNFDAIQQNDTHYDPKGTIVSQQIVEDTNKNNGNSTSNSPVDDNMAAREQVKDDKSTSSHKEEKTNYDVGKSQIKTVKAPGAITKLTTSVLLNGNIDENTRTSVNNLVMGAIGYNEKRGDTITVEAMNFDKSLQNQAKKDLEEMIKEKHKAKIRKMIMMISLIIAVLLIILGVLLTKIIKKRKLQKETEESELQNVQQIDTIIGDNEEKKQEYKPIEFEEENEKTHIEKEIKDYANKKPDQVAEVVRSWLTEDER